MEAIIVATHDGFDLAAHRFPAAGTPRAVVVLPCAMGVKQNFYFPFAHFLAQQGFAALTFRKGNPVQQVARRRQLLEDSADRKALRIWRPHFTDTP